MGPVNWFECAHKDCDSFVSRPISVGIVPVKVCRSKENLVSCVRSPSLRENALHVKQYF